MRASFLVNQRAVAFGKAGARQNQTRFFHGRGALMIEHDNVVNVAQGRVHLRFRRVTVEIVLHDHHRVGAAALQLVQRVVKRHAADHARADAVGGGGDQRNADVGAAAFQRARYVSRRFNHRFAAGMGAGDD